MKRPLYIFIPIIFCFLTSCNSDNQESKTIHQINVINKDYSITGNKSIDSLKQLCFKAGSVGDYKTFRELSNKVYSLDSNLVDVIGGLSLISFLEDDYNTSLKLINKAIKLDTGNIYENNYTLKACIFLELNNKDSSDLYFKKMISINKYNGIDINTIVLSTQLFNFPDKTNKYIDIANKYYPTDVDAIENKSILEINKGNYLDAISLLNKLEKHKTQDPEFFYYRSICFSKLKKYEQALADAILAVKIEENNSKYITLRGRMKQRLGDKKGAEIDFKNAISKGDTMAERFYRSL